jgi:hypothetical protein
MKASEPNLHDGGVRQYRLHRSPFWVDVRLLEINGRWIASADAVDGPTLGCGTTSFDALWQALAPYDGVIGDLLASLPSEAR